MVIPSATEVIQTWIHCFGFEPFDMTTKTLMKDTNVVKFYGAEMLQKKIQKHNISGENLSFIEGMYDLVVTNFIFTSLINFDG